MASKPTYVASVREPESDDAAHAEWRVRLRRDELTGACVIEIRFKRRDGSWQTCQFPAADRGSPYKLLRLLHSLDARLPDDGKSARRFVDDLIRATPVTAVIATSCPGWRDHARGFVMPNRMYGTAAKRFVWDAGVVKPDWGAIRGSLNAYQRDVLGPARHSTHLTVAILLGLASPLVGYVEGRRERRLLAETLLMHWAGETSTGKTTVARVAQSVIGSSDPSALADYRLSERRIAEQAYHRNDLLAVFDETEHLDDAADLFAKMKMITQCVTGGRSKQITAALHGAFPQLAWTCFGVSTGPMTQVSLARQLDKLRHGQAARFVDISVGSPRDGGIFDTLSAVNGATPAQLVKQIDDCILTHHGVLLDAWIRHLLAVDVSEGVERLAHAFASELAGNVGGLEGRLAIKFGLLYAAAMIAIDAGLLPWSKSWARTAIICVYRNAVSTRDPAAGTVDKVVRALAEAVKSSERFPRINPTQNGVPPVLLSPRAIGFIVPGGRSGGGYLIPARLSVLGIDDPDVQRRVRDAIKDQPGDSGSSLFRGVEDGERFKIRGWRFTPSSLAAAAARVTFRAPP